jgi:transcriptional regulator with XRE-family HTH domain
MIEAFTVRPHLPDVSGYNAAVTDDRAVWQLQIERLVGDEHGRRKTVAKAAGMSPSQFGDLINKPGKNPQIRQLQRIADALGKDVADLFSSGSLDRQEAPRNASPPVVAAPIDPTLLAPAIREALALVLMQVVSTLADTDEPTRESTPNTGTG